MEDDDLLLLARMIGSSLPPARLRAVIDAYGSVLDEIAKLRSLDLGDIHPAVIFEPTAPYRVASK